MENELEKLDVIGFKLQDGLEIIKKKYTSNIKIIETIGLSRHKTANLEEPRILKVSKSDNGTIEVIISFF